MKWEQINTVLLYNLTVGIHSDGSLFILVFNVNANNTRADRDDQRCELRVSPLTDGV